jgi:dUTP pyrophosphatase
MEVLIKYHNLNCQIKSYGNWIDLKSAENIEFKLFENKLIPLGVSMKLPKYFQANIVPRSGTYKKYGLIQANHYGVVDGPDDKSNGYSGNNDIWMFNAIAFRDTKINIGDRICQFEIRLTMKAPWWVKLKWLFDNKIEFIEVEDLKSKNRGGFGSTGK